MCIVSLQAQITCAQAGGSLAEWASVDEFDTVGSAFRTALSVRTTLQVFEAFIGLIRGPCTRWSDRSYALNKDGRG